MSRSPADPRDVFSRDLDLPRGTRRQPVRDRDRSVELRESEVRILATTGAFRVVPAKDLLDHRGRPSSSRQGELRRLREEGLVEARPYVVGREKTSLVTLTERGRELLEQSSDRARRCRPAGVLRRRGEAARTGARFTAVSRLRARGRTPAPRRLDGQASRPRLRAEARLSALPARSQSRAPARRA